MRLLFLAVACGLALTLTGCAEYPAPPGYSAAGPSPWPYSPYAYPYEPFEPEPYFIGRPHEHHGFAERREEREEHESAQEEHRETPQQERHEEHEEHERGER